MAKKRATRPASHRSTTKKAAKKTPRMLARPKAAPPRAARRKAAKRGASARVARPSEIFAPVVGAERREVGHVLLEVGKAGAARVKRMVYPAGFRWSVDMKPVVG